MEPAVVSQPKLDQHIAIPFTHSGTSKNAEGVVTTQYDEELGLHPGIKRRVGGRRTLVVA
jgi:hypothetical protein